MKPTVPVMTTPVAEVAKPTQPAMLVRCQCPRYTWANKATLEIVDQDGYTPEYFCLECAPEPMRTSAKFLIENRAALGIPEGAPLRVDVEEVDAVRWPGELFPHGGHLN